MTKLSILICTLPEPFYIRGLQRLKAILDPQVQKHSDKVEVIINDAGRSMTTGRKRNELIDRSEGEYFVFIDSDDLVPEYYVSELLNAIEKCPDVISFIGFMTTNGVNRREFTIKKDERYEERNGHYFRWCNHLCCFNKSKVRHIRFPDVTIQEDYLWSKKIKESSILKTEIHINKIMYHYDFIDKKRIPNRY